MSGGAYYDSMNRKRRSVGLEFDWSEVLHDGNADVKELRFSKSRPPGSELLLRSFITSQLVDLIELRPAVGQGEEHGLADDLAQADRQREVPFVREVVEILLVVLVSLSEHVPRREASAECRPRDADAAEYEAYVRVLGRSRDNGQQVPSHVDLSRPELNEGEILQL